MLATFSRENLGQKVKNLVLARSTAAGDHHDPLRARLIEEGAPGGLGQGLEDGAPEEKAAAGDRSSTDAKVEQAEVAAAAASPVDESKTSEEPQGSRSNPRASPIFGFESLLANLADSGSGSDVTGGEEEEEKAEGGRGDDEGGRRGDDEGMTSETGAEEEKSLEAEDRLFNLWSHHQQQHQTSHLGKNQVAYSRVR